MRGSENITRLKTKDAARLVIAMACFLQLVASSLAQTPMQTSELSSEEICHTVLDAIEKQNSAPSLQGEFFESFRFSADCKSEVFNVTIEITELAQSEYPEYLEQVLTRVPASVCAMEWGRAFETGWTMVFQVGRKGVSFRPTVILETCDGVAYGDSAQ